MQTYFAMTPDELRLTTSLPGPIGWMACHFDPKGSGIIDVPQYLPAGSVLLLDDSLPVHGHNPNRIRQELELAYSRLRFNALLLDFQRESNPETAALVDLFVQLPFPVVVSSLYSVPGAALLLPPPPVDTSLDEYISPWIGHPLWLELSPTITTLRLSATGTSVSPFPGSSGGILHKDKMLHCHYQIFESKDAVFFHMHRTPEDIKSLLRHAEELGISNTIGLYQELQTFQTSETV